MKKIVLLLVFIGLLTGCKNEKKIANDTVENESYTPF